MIQRIQTLFLVIAVIAGVLLFFVPLGSYETESLHKYYVHGVFDQADGSTLVNTWPLIALVIAHILICLAAVFLYKKRSLQTTLCHLSTLLILVLLLLVFYYGEYEIDTAEHPLDYSSGILLPVLAAIFTVLAQRSIRKDENLVRSLDRVR